MTYILTSYWGCWLTVNGRSYPREHAGGRPSSGQGVVGCALTRMLETRWEILAVDQFQADNTIWCAPCVGRESSDFSTAVTIKFKRSNSAAMAGNNCLSLYSFVVSFKPYSCQLWSEEAPVTILYGPVRHSILYRHVIFWYISTWSRLHVRTGHSNQCVDSAGKNAIYGTAKILISTHPIWTLTLQMRTVIDINTKYKKERDI